MAFASAHCAYRVHPIVCSNGSIIISYSHIADHCTYLAERIVNERICGSVKVPAQVGDIEVTVERMKAVLLPLTASHHLKGASNLREMLNCISLARFMGCQLAQSVFARRICHCLAGKSREEMERVLKGAQVRLPSIKVIAARELATCLEQAFKPDVEAVRAWFKVFLTEADEKLTTPSKYRDSSPSERAERIQNAPSSALRKYANLFASLKYPDRSSSIDLVHGVSGIKTGDESKANTAAELIKTFTAQCVAANGKYKDWLAALHKHEEIDPAAVGMLTDMVVCYAATGHKIAEILTQISGVTYRAAPALETRLERIAMVARAASSKPRAGDANHRPEKWQIWNQVMEIIDANQSTMQRFARILQSINAERNSLTFDVGWLSGCSYPDLTRWTVRLLVGRTYKFRGILNATAQSTQDVRVKNVLLSVAAVLGNQHLSNETRVNMVRIMHETLVNCADGEKLVAGVAAMAATQGITREVKHQLEFISEQFRKYVNS